jgi:predicted amidophosphoribosyltransferase
MNCPKCGKENAESAQFCAHCGEPLMPMRYAQPQQVMKPVLVHWESFSFAFRGRSGDVLYLEG